MAVVKAVFSLEPYARPTMDARQYFSPFNKNSPLYGYDRDTAETAFYFNTLTASGQDQTILHTGVMSDIPIKGRQAELEAVSGARIDLNKSITMPTVYGYREGCTVDWAAGYLAAVGARYAGQAPTPYTRGWVPCYGSVHSYIEGPYTYNYSLSSTASMLPGQWIGHKDPTSVQGPYYVGMYAQQRTALTEELTIHFIRPSTNVNENFSALVEDDLMGATAPVTMDVFSQANSRGKITFWMRDDTWDAAPANLAAADQFLFDWDLSIVDRTGVTLGRVHLSLRAADGKLAAQIGSDAAGYSNYIYTTPGNFVSNSQWKFIGFHWDFAAGQLNMSMNGTDVVTTSFATDGRNVISQLPPTDAQGLAAGHTINAWARAHMPMSEFMWDVGYGYEVGQWTKYYPLANTPGRSMITRPTYQKIVAIAEPTPVVAWDTLADLARNCLAMYRANEDDLYEFLPLTYFGETAQLTSAAIEDTQKNAQDLDVTLDPSKSRNVITLEYVETAVSTQPTTVMEISQALQIPRGTTIITFTLDLLTAEMHGASQPFDPIWTLTNLDSTAITTAVLPSLVHFASFNTQEDGAGAILGTTSVYAQILSWDAATITLQFTNLYGAAVWLSNNGNSVPFMRILGYAVGSNTAYSTVRDPGSISIRQDRAISAQMNWIQDRSTAQDVASYLAALLSRPRAQVKVTVNGDPRRQPGQLVTIKDAEGTAAAGSWRLLAVDHNISGGKYTQDLSLVRVGPVALWDDPTTTWDDAVWGP
jgi:hypothetical protein